MTKGFVLYSIVLMGVIASSALGGYIQDKFITSDGQANDHFGRSVSLSSNTCVAGFSTGDEKGSIYVFRFDGQEWIEEQQLPSPDPRYQDLFGESVAVDSGLILAGNAYKDNFTRTVYTFRKQQ